MLGEKLGYVNHQGEVVVPVKYAMGVSYSYSDWIIEFYNNGGFEYGN
jgi:hypothetical protein